MYKNIFAFFLLFFSVSVFANHYSLLKSKQLVIVTVNHPKSSQATMQLLARPTLHSDWRYVGKPFSVVIGKNGSTKNKKEGDNKTPEGLFTIYSAFGISKMGRKLTKMPYRIITPNIVCVDDKNSQFYNQIVNKKRILKSDWRSGERMFNYKKAYRFGLRIGNNMRPIVSGKGSCVFMHVWKSKIHPTAGCIAMSKRHIKQLLKWLNPESHPFVLIKKRSTSAQVAKFISSLA